MHLELLEENHSGSLLTFEIENQNWFESYIAPRDDNFYNTLGVNNHIRLCNAEHKDGTAYYFIIKKGQEIIGRINLRDICVEKKSASLGYRVAKKHAGKGVASFAVEALVNFVRQKLKLTSLISYVLTNNPASDHVLLKQGFKAVRIHKDYTSINNEIFDSKEYQYLL